MTKGERIETAARDRGDDRMRCETEGHVLCEQCAGCACLSGTDHLDRTEYPNDTFRVTRDKYGRSLCRECRYQSDEMGNF